MVDRPSSYGAAGALYTRQGSWKSGCGHSAENRPAMKSHNPDCARIEKFAGTLAPMKSYQFCVQDFTTKDYTLQFDGKSVTITPQQFDDGTWPEIVRRAFQ
jgi:hypothetical protein